MLSSPDFKELLNLFNGYNVRYLIVGGYAVMKYTEPRFTKDLDIWIATDEENAKNVYSALKEFGAPLTNLTYHDFMSEDYFYQMGRAPFRLDIVMSITGVSFEPAWKNKIVVQLQDMKIPFISKEDLIKNKEALGRPQDMIDVKNLKKSIYK